jgi:NAD(P)-dependent dehydrogenase (short-subunit alcohol dehydrogenase family)
MGGRLAGKIAVVTGASSGIGAASAKALCREGAKVAVVARRLPEGEEVATQARAAGANADGDAVFVGADVTDEAAVAAMVASVAECFGPSLHVLFNNVGGAVGGGRFPRERLENFEANIRQSLTSTWMVSKAFWSALEAANGASIINNSTGAALGVQTPGLRPLLPHYLPSGYPASKAAVEALTRYLAQEGAPVGIRANFIRPGHIATPLIELSDGTYYGREYMETLQLITRMGTPEDVAGTVVFLGSDESSFITGQGIDVDGGLINKR